MIDILLGDNITVDRNGEKISIFRYPEKGIRDVLGGKRKNAFKLQTLWVVELLFPGQPCRKMQVF